MTKSFYATVLCYHAGLKKNKKIFLTPRAGGAGEILESIKTLNLTSYCTKMTRFDTTVYTRKLGKIPFLHSLLSLQCVGDYEG